MTTVLFRGKELNTESGTGGSLNGDAWYKQILEGKLPHYNESNVAIYKALATGGYLDDDTIEWVLDYYEECKYYDEVIKRVWVGWKIAAGRKPPGVLQGVDDAFLPDVIRVLETCANGGKCEPAYLQKRVKAMQLICTPDAKRLTAVCEHLKKIAPGDK